MMAGFFCVIWIWNIFIVFLPLYLQEERGVSIANSGWLAAVPYLGAAILGITGGWVMTRYAKKAGRDPLLAKRHVMSVAAVIAGILICLIPFVDSLPLALAVMTVALGFVATMQAAAWAMPGDIVDNSQVASVGAIQNFGGYFGGAFAPLLTGVIADATGSYAPSFVIGGIIAALAAVAYTVLVREPIRDKTAERRQKAESTHEHSNKRIDETAVANCGRPGGGQPPARPSPWRSRPTPPDRTEAPFTGTWACSGSASKGINWDVLPSYTDPVPLADLAGVHAVLSLGHIAFDSRTAGPCPGPAAGRPVRGGLRNHRPGRLHPRRRRRHQHPGRHSPAAGRRGADPPAGALAQAPGQGPADTDVRLGRGANTTAAHRWWARRSASWVSAAWARSSPSCWPRSG